MPQDAPPAHLDTTVQAIARMHADHHRAATPLQRLADRTTARAGRPSTLVWLLAFVIAWIATSLAVEVMGGQSPDPPPFALLQGLLGFGALGMTVLILTTQRRENQIAESREQLTLELAALSEQKITKVIQLLEELRRDTPFVRDREDPEADALGQPADPQEVLEHLRETHAAMIEAPLSPEGSDGIPKPPPGLILSDSP